MTTNIGGSVGAWAQISIVNPLIDGLPGKEAASVGMSLSHASIQSSHHVFGKYNIDLTNVETAGAYYDDQLTIKNMIWANTPDASKVYMNSINTGAGNDYLSIERSALYTLKMGAGNDTLDANGTYVSLGDLGDGDDTAIYGLSETLTLSEEEVGQKHMNGFNDAILDGGAGTDELILTGEWTVSLNGTLMFTLDLDGDGIADTVSNTIAYSNISQVLSWPVMMDGTVIWPDAYGIQQKMKFKNFEKISGICFTAGTMLETEKGLRRIDTLRPGDLVLTNQGLKPLKWIGNRRLDIVDLAANHNLLPVRIPAGAFGNGLPFKDLWFSPQHRVAVRSKLSEKMFGIGKVLCACKHLVGVHGIEVDTEVDHVSYFHILFDEHCTIMVEGIEAETLYRGQNALNYLTEAGLAELRFLFDDIDAILSGEVVVKSAEPLLTAREAKALAARHRKYDDEALYY